MYNLPSWHSSPIADDLDAVDVAKSGEEGL